jgi:hypothetical protein
MEDVGWDDDDDQAASRRKLEDAVARAQADFDAETRGRRPPSASPASAESVAPPPATRPDGSGVST